MLGSYEKRVDRLVHHLALRECGRVAGRVRGVRVDVHDVRYIGVGRGGGGVLEFGERPNSDPIQPDGRGDGGQRFRGHPYRIGVLQDEVEPQLGVPCENVLDVPFQAIIRVSSHRHRYSCSAPAAPGRRAPVCGASGGNPSVSLHTRRTRHVRRVIEGGRGAERSNRSRRGPLGGAVGFRRPRRTSDFIRGSP